MRDRDAIVVLPNNSSMRDSSVRAVSRTTHFAGLKIFEMRWWEPGMVRHAPRGRRKKPRFELKPWPSDFIIAV